LAEKIVGITQEIKTLSLQQNEMDFRILSYLCRLNVMCNDPLIQIYICDKKALHVEGS
jgi:hypothetical protein